MGTSTGIRTGNFRMMFFLLSSGTFEILNSGTGFDVVERDSGRTWGGILRFQEILLVLEGKWYLIGVFYHFFRRSRERSDQWRHFYHFFKYFFLFLFILLHFNVPCTWSFWHFKYVWSIAQAQVWTVSFEWVKCGANGSSGRLTQVQVWINSLGPL